METGEVIYEKVYASPRPPPKISLKHDWMKELGSEVVRQPEGEVVQQSLVDPTDKNRKDPDTIDLGAPRLAQYMHKAWKKHQNTVYWVDIKLAQKKGFGVLSHKM